MTELPRLQPRHAEEGIGIRSVPRHAEEGIGIRSVPRHAEEGIGIRSVPRHAEEPIGIRGSLPRHAEEPIGIRSLPALQRMLLEEPRHTCTSSSTVATSMPRATLLQLQ
jgi:hypothetical protein